ncbi:MAG: formylmethanofuran dehydrogenase subunit B, partial [Burkholderiales bacterium]
MASAEQACAIGERWFMGAEPERSRGATIDGKPASLDHAYDCAAQLIATAKYPLIYGLANTTCEAQREALALADTLHAVIDTPASVCLGPASMAFQRIGVSMATLGEIRNRADLVVYWRASALETHPRHLERYSVFPKGLHIPAGRQDRTLV